MRAVAETRPRCRSSLPAVIAELIRLAEQRSLGSRRGVHRSDRATMASWMDPEMACVSADTRSDAIRYSPASLTGLAAAASARSVCTETASSAFWSMCGPMSQSRRGFRSCSIVPESGRTRRRLPLLAFDGRRDHGRGVPRARVRVARVWSLVVDHKSTHARCGAGAGRGVRELKLRLDGPSRGRIR